MSATLIIYILILALILVIGIVVSIGFLTAALIKHDKKLMKGIPISILAAVLLCVLFNFAFWKFEEDKKDQFDNIEMVTIDNDSQEHSITILNDGSKSMGSFAKYCILDDSVVVETKEVEKQCNLLMKFGYRFVAKSEGRTVIAILEHDCGKLNYVDFYTVTVDENRNIFLDKSEHFDVGESDTLEEVIPEEYSFIFCKNIL